jgi:4-hydroxybutyrate CoA-transferase
MASRLSYPGWEDHYQRRSVTAAEAVAAVQPGDHIWVSLGQQVGLLTTALLGRLESGQEPIWLTTASGDDFSWYAGDFIDQLRLNFVFAAAGSREPVNDFRADYTPWWVWGAHKAREEHRPASRQIDVAMIRVSPPNQHGWCCFGNTQWDAKKTARMARTVLAVTSDAVPRTYGDSWIHASEIDWFVDNSAAEAEQMARFAALVAAMGAAEAGPVERAMAANVAELVNDGDTVQVGTGTTTSALVKAGVFDGKHDLGYFAELTVGGLVELARLGVINGSRMVTHPGKFVTTMAGMLPGESTFVDGNPAFEFYGTDYMHDPAAIARNPNMVAINNALSVDLTGQIVAGHFGHRIWSGTGGQLAYAIGAFLSPGGRSITVLPSTTAEGAISRISAEFPAGQVVTVPRDIADIIVTEHGVANLLNKTQRQRAEEMIALAHPDHRAELRKAASKQFGL